MAKKPNKKKCNLFVYVVDSYGDGLGSRLQKMGLVSDESFEITGAGGADFILQMQEKLTAEHLLVFMSSFHGEVAPAVELAKRIKEANPNARIIFRSNTEHSDDPVFELNMSKRGSDWDEFFTIIERFVAQYGDAPVSKK